MTESVIFIIGLFVTSIVAVAVLLIAREDAIDRKLKGREIGGAVDGALLKTVDTDRIGRNERQR